MLTGKWSKAWIANEPRGQDTFSRNETQAGCWGGRIVSGDAIERVIGKLRKLQVELAPGSFRITTIYKVGYELIIAEQEPF
jgi:DNA-binding winged helix-turn-helix (wHTH) protein